MVCYHCLYSVSDFSNKQKDEVLAPHVYTLLFFIKTLSQRHFTGIFRNCRQWVHNLLTNDKREIYSGTGVPFISIQENRAKTKTIFRFSASNYAQAYSYRKKFSNFSILIHFHFQLFIHHQCLQEINHKKSPWLFGWIRHNSRWKAALVKYDHSFLTWIVANAPKMIFSCGSPNHWVN